MTPQDKQNQKAQKWDARYAAKEWVWSAEPNATFAARVSATKPGLALDLACGEGRNALWLAEQGWQVDALDFSSVAIDKAQQIAQRRGVVVNWQVADLCAGDWQANHYDMVCVIYVHTSRQERTIWLTAALKAVKQGGVFIYVGHDPSNIEHGVGGPQDPELLPSVDELVSFIATNHGDEFDVGEAQVIKRPTTADSGHGGQGIALDNVVCAVRR